MIDLIFKKLILAQAAITQGNVGGGTGTGGSLGGGTGPNDFKLPNPLGDDTTSLADLLERIFEYLFKIAVPITAIMVLIGAFQLMFAGGNEEKVKTGKKTILYAVVGFAIVLLADGITAVMKEILGFKG